MKAVLINPFVPNIFILFRSICICNCTHKMVCTQTLPLPSHLQTLSVHLRSRDFEGTSRCKYFPKTNSLLVSQPCWQTVISNSKARMRSAPVHTGAVAKGGASGAWSPHLKYVLPISCFAPRCCIHPILCFKNVAPSCSFCPPLCCEILATGLVHTRRDAPAQVFRGRTCMIQEIFEFDME